LFPTPSDGFYSPPLQPPKTAPGSLYLHCTSSGVVIERRSWNSRKLPLPFVLRSKILPIPECTLVQGFLHGGARCQTNAARPARLPPSFCIAKAFEHSLQNRNEFRFCKNNQKPFILCTLKACNCRNGLPTAPPLHYSGQNNFCRNSTRHCRSGHSLPPGESKQFQERTHRLSSGPEDEGEAFRQDQPQAH
jgi:hypothetical protein